MTNSTILQLKIAATLFAYDCPLGWAQLGSSSGPASGNSCGYVQLAGQLGRVGIWECLLEEPDRLWSMGFLTVRHD